MIEPARALRAGVEPLDLFLAEIEYGRRKKPIGGWLLFLFWSVFAGGVIILVSIDIKSYLPETWNDPLLTHTS
jgi:hypothetical protein